MKKVKTQKGITLVALIITIVVLLILAAVAISSIQNQGILSYAENAAKHYNQAQVNEKDTLEGYLEHIPGAENQGEGNQGSGEETQITGPLGTAVNTEDYGKKVVGFTSKGEGLSDLVWRVFYRDANNVYLISEASEERVSFYQVVSEEKVKNEILEKYENGADVSRQGQDLMPIASTLFTDSNTNPNIIATAYMCDIDVWDQYTDAAGNAAWAMGGPTLELFLKSYNTTQADGSEIEISLADAYGYTIPYSSETDQNNGIYNGEWWISSPSQIDAGWVMQPFNCFHVAYESPIRPVVCIPVSNFNYTLE